MFVEHGQISSFGGAGFIASGGLKQSFFRWFL